VCSKKKVVWVKCNKTIHKKKYVPYYCYYSKFAVITGDRAAYLSKLLFKIREYRKTNTHFRLILKQLLIKQKISKEIFKKVDSIEVKKMRDLEVAIVSKKVSIKFIESQIGKYKSIMKKLGYLEYKPKVCRTISGKRVCGLSEKNSKKKVGRVYVSKKLFTKIIFIQKRAKIIGVSKKTDYVIVKHQSKQWVKKSLRINPSLRSIILNIAFAKLFKQNNINKYVKKTLSKMKKSKRTKLNRYLKQKIGRKIIIRKIIEKKIWKRFKKWNKKNFKI